MYECVASSSFGDVHKDVEIKLVGESLGCGEGRGGRGGGEGRRGEGWGRGGGGV